MNKGTSRAESQLLAKGRPVQPAYAKIYSVLHDHLRRNALQAGLVLGQASVARVFNVSRVPAGVALSKLMREGLIETFQGKGYIVPGAEPLRVNLFEAGLTVPAHVAAPPINRREQIYPEVERAVAVCLAYGRFLLNETALAQHYDVSRTIAHEVLAQLERAGVIEQDSNNRWYAGPLSASEFRHHYEIRMLLEPEALRQAFPYLKRKQMQFRLDRLLTARRNATLPAMLEELETDLHIRTLQPCSNAILLNALRRSQRVLIATHSTFVNYRQPADIALMASEHIEIYEALCERDIEAAIAILKGHLQRSINVNLEMLRRLAPLPERLRPPYLIMVEPS